VVVDFHIDDIGGVGVETDAHLQSISRQFA